MTPVLALRSVSKHYPGGVTALNDVSLRILAGELVAIVGPSGSGKSTLLHLIGTLDLPSSGTVEIDGQDVSSLSDRRLSIPELGSSDYARRGFNVIATANLRDKGVSEMSAALKRRFNFETVSPIPDLARETELVRRRASQILAEAGKQLGVDDAVIEALVTVFRDLRAGRTVEGWAVERPTSVMSTAEAVAVASALGLASAYFPSERDTATLLPEYLLGVVMKDEPKDRGKLLAYWDGAIKRRAETDARLWKQLYEKRARLEA